MSRNKSRDALVLVLDVGRSVSKCIMGEKESFFEKSRKCLSWILQRKLISESKDLASILLIGDNDSKNALVVSGYENICCKFDFQEISFDMLKFIETEVKTTTLTSDWIGGLIVSMEMLKLCEESNSLSKKSIVFFSDFTHPITDGIKSVMKHIKAMNIDLIIIGSTFKISDEGVDEGQPAKRKRFDNESAEQIKAEEVLYKMYKELDGAMKICSFEVALKQLSSYPRKEVKSSAWNSTLDIGNVGIKISAYKKTELKKGFSLVTKYLKSSSVENINQPSTSNAACASGLSSAEVEKVNIVRDYNMYYKHQDDTTKEIGEVSVQKEDIIEGYRYGTTIVPFSAEDKEEMAYKAGSKSLSVLGFTAISNVPHYLLTGESAYIITPRKNDPLSEEALSALVQAMKECNFLAIARRVYSDNKGLRLGILYPLVEEIDFGEEEVVHKECLLFIQLAFGEELVPMHFQSLESVSKNITPQQMELIDKFIDEMDLMEADRDMEGNPCEALDVYNLHNLKEQFHHYNAIQRGLFPSRPISKNLPSFFKELAMVPETLVNKSKQLGEELKKLFTIQIKTEKDNFKKNDENIILNNSESQPEISSTINSNESQTSESSDATIDNPEFSLSFNPNETTEVRNLKSLFIQQHLPSEEGLKMVFERVEIEMPDIIECFRECLITVREKYLNRNPDKYNYWMYAVKSVLLETGGICSKLWEIMKSENLCLITVRENKLSSVDEEENDEFMTKPLSPPYPCRSPEVKRKEFGPIPKSLDPNAAKKEAMDMLF